MRVDFSAARLTVVVAPVDMRAGFAKLATIAESLLQIPVASGGHYVAFVSKHRKLCKVIWCDDSGSCLLTRVDSTRGSSRGSWCGSMRAARDCR